jgi:hypothetical protein
MGLNLLLHFPIGKDIFHRDIKFSQIVFPPPVSIPADAFD